MAGYRTDPRVIRLEMHRHELVTHLPDSRFGQRMPMPALPDQRAEPRLDVHGRHTMAERSERKGQVAPASTELNDPRIGWQAKVAQKLPDGDEMFTRGLATQRRVGEGSDNRSLDV